MTLILKRNIDMVKMSHRTKNEARVWSRSSKVIAWKDRQTDTQVDTDTHTQYENITLSYT